MNVESKLKKIHMMPRGVERSLELYYLAQYSHYLLHKGIISEDEYKSIAKEADYKRTGRKISNADIVDTLVQLTCLYEEVLKYSNNYTLFYISPYISFQEYLPFVFEFFKYIDNNLYNHFCNIKYNDFFSIIPEYDNQTSGTTYDIGMGKSSILLKENTYFNLIKNLVHEMGHAYENFLNQTSPCVKSNYFAQECLSISLELLFMKFLRDNHLGDSTIIDEGERRIYTNKLRFMNNAYIFNNLVFDEKSFKYEEINNVGYTISLNTYNELSLIKMNHKFFIDDKEQVTNYHNFYGYGLLFALVILDMFTQDEKEARNIIKTFPSFINSHKEIEIINRFSDDEYLEANKKYADRVLSKTHYKKV